jgi:excisionase family DNA binding protein
MRFSTKERRMGKVVTSPAGPVLPSEAEAKMACELSRKIAARLGAGATVKIEVGDKAGALTLPPIAARLVLDLLEELARGNAVTLNAIRAELTTQQAADLLNISRPSLIQLLDDGKIAYRRLGTHRRIPLEDVLAFKADNYAKRKAALDELSNLHQELGLE